MDQDLLDNYPTVLFYTKITNQTPLIFTSQELS